MKILPFLLAAAATLGLADASMMKPGTWETRAESRLEQYPNLKPTVSTVRFCVTAEDAAGAEVNLGPKANCRMTKIKWSGKTYSAELVCPGPPASVNKIALTFQDAEHFTGRYDMTIQTGNGLHSIATVEGKRIAPDCM